MQARLDCTN